jgi:hypothetical protein
MNVLFYKYFVESFENDVQQVIVLNERIPLSLDGLDPKKTAENPSNGYCHQPLIIALWLYFIIFQDTSKCSLLIKHIVLIFFW